MVGICENPGESLELSPEYAGETGNQQLSNYGVTRLVTAGKEIPKSSRNLRENISVDAVVVASPVQFLKAINDPISNIVAGEHCDSLKSNRGSIKAASQQVGAGEPVGYHLILQRKVCTSAFPG